MATAQTGILAAHAPGPLHQGGPGDVSACVSRAVGAFLSAAALYWSAMVRPTEQAGDGAADLRDVSLACDGDGHAYERLVRRHQAQVAAWMWRFTRDTSEHEELVHDVFVEAWKSLAGYRRQGPFEHWLHKIAVRAGYRLWKRKGRRSFEASVDGETLKTLALQPDDVDARAAARAVHDTLAKLAPRDRLVLTLHYLEGRSMAEIAELAGWSRSMAKVQAWRARSRLRKLLEDAGWKEEDLP